MILLSISFAIGLGLVLPTSTYGQFASLKNCLIHSNVNASQIVQRSDNCPEYNDLNYQWQLHGGLKKPMGYLLPTQTSHIQSAVKCARKFNIQVVPKSGGHSYGKFSHGDSVNTLVIDLQRMSEVTVDPTDNERSIVGAGTLTGHLAWKLWKSGEKLLPIGICPTVGIGGLALGGGHGYLSRTYGLMMDNILEMELVDSAGSVLTLNNKTNSDLFWALRGAGGGSFGIVTKFIFKIHPAPQQVIYLINVYELDMFPEVFVAWQAFAKSNSWNSISTALHVKDNSVRLEFVSFQTGSVPEGKLSSEFILSLFNSSFPSTSHPENSVEFLTYPEFLLKMAHQFGMITKPAIIQGDDMLQLGRHSFGQSYMKAKSFYGKAVLDDPADLAKLALLVKQLPGKAVLYFLSYGGIVNDVGPEQTAFIHRKGILYHCEIVQYGTLKDELEGFPWLEAFFQTTKQMLRHNESYQNYVDEDLPDYLQRYYGGNLESLIDIKTRIDPDNYFHNRMSIPVKGAERFVTGTGSSVSMSSRSSIVKSWIYMVPCFVYFYNIMHM